MSALARAHNIKILFESNVCNIFCRGFSRCLNFWGVFYSRVSTRQELTVPANGTPALITVPFPPYTFSHSACWSVTQSVTQSVSLSVSLSVSWSVSQSFIHLVRQSFHAAMLMISKNVRDLTNQLSFQPQAMINTNYLAGVYTSHSVVKRMKERRKGHIVFVSSIGGQVLILIELCTFLSFCQPCS